MDIVESRRNGPLLSMRHDDDDDDDDVLPSDCPSVCSPLDHRIRQNMK